MVFVFTGVRMCVRMCVCVCLYVRMCMCVCVTQNSADTVYDEKGVAEDMLDFLHHFFAGT